MALAVIMRPLRICLVCNEYPPAVHGGIGTSTQLLARGLVAAGHLVRVIGVYRNEHGAADYEEDQGVRVWRLREPRFRIGWIAARYRLFRQIARWSREGKINLVEVPDWQGWAAAWPRLAVPVVARLRGSATYIAAELGTGLKRSAFYLERASLKRADFRCSVSNYTAQKTLRRFGLPVDKVATLYNSVKMPDETLCVKHRKQEVVFSGTLTPMKGLFSLVTAWPDVLLQCCDAKLHVFGKDRPDDNGQSMVESLRQRLPGPIGASVFFHGHVPRERVFEALQRARVAVFPSYVESFAMAPLEAMACGCPTIYSRRASGPELIDHDRNGLLVDPDDPGEIADSIIRVLKNDQLANRLGPAGRQHVRQGWSLAGLVARNAQFYRQCIEDFHGSRRGQDSPVSEDALAELPKKLTSHTTSVEYLSEPERTES